VHAALPRTNGDGHSLQQLEVPVFAGATEEP